MRIKLNNIGIYDWASWLVNGQVLVV